jgi:hypothetical protein
VWRRSIASSLIRLRACGVKEIMRRILIKATTAQKKNLQNKRMKIMVDHVLIETSPMTNREFTKALLVLMK